MSDQLPAEQEALVWCLEHGVKAVNWCTTGFWDQRGVDGSEIMPPANIHAVLDAARQEVIRRREST